MSIENSYIFETTDINHAAYLTSIKGYKINDIRRVTNEKNGKQVVSFVFYDNLNTINLDIAEFINGDVAKFNQCRNELLSLIRQTNQFSKEEFLDKANK